MPATKLIIFDCDGVLVDSEPLANRIMTDYLNENGLSISFEQTLQRFVGLSQVSLRNTVLNEDGITLPDDFEEEILRRDHLVFKKDLKAIDGVSDAIRSLTGRYCLASSGGHNKIATSLTLTGLLNLFTNKVFSADDVNNGKPAPDLFLHAASEMNTPPGNAIVIEDSVAGVLAGVAAGMQVFGFLGGGHITEGHAARLMDAGAERVFDRMSDLGKVISDRLRSEQPI